MAGNSPLDAPSGYTEVEATATPPDASLFYKLITADGTETPTVTRTGGGSGFAAGTLIFLPAAPSGSALLLRRRRD